VRTAPHPLTLRQLQYAVAVAELRSFRRAADRCHVSQPALSAQVAELERALEARLFERDRRRVHVTRKGAALLERARALLVQADDLADAARGGDAPLASTLRIGVLSTVAPYLLPDAVPLLRRRFARLTLHWLEDRTQPLAAALAEAELDLAIVALASQLPGLALEVIGRDEFVLAAPPGHPLARSRRPLRPAELHGEPLLLLADGHCFRDQVEAFCARSGAVEPGFRATSLSTLAQMAAGGAAATILPSLALPLENRRGLLVVRRFAAPVPARTLALVARPGSPVRAALLPLAAALRDGLARASMPARGRGRLVSAEAPGS
jgi:LysR family hydrogen peroxide-inducible transcriptional activator